MCDNVTKVEKTSSCNNKGKDARNVFSVQFKITFFQTRTVSNLSIFTIFEVYFLISLEVVTKNGTTLV